MRSLETKTLAFNYAAPWPQADPQPLASRTPRGAATKTPEARAAYEAATKRCLDAWRVANPASWITDEFLLRQALAPELSAAEVLQLHAGVWAAGEYAWLTREAWMSAAQTGYLIPGDPSRSASTVPASTTPPRSSLAASPTGGSPSSACGKPRGARRAGKCRGTRSTRPSPKRSRRTRRSLLRRPSVLAVRDRGVGASVGRQDRHRVGDVPREADECRARAVRDGLRRRPRQARRRPERCSGTSRTRFATRRGTGTASRKPAKNSDRKIDLAVTMVLAYEARCDAVASGFRKRSRELVTF
jgi:hypothetical protein